MALGVATFAVLFVAFLAGRDFIRDVYPECAGSLEPTFESSPNIRRLERVTLNDASPQPGQPTLLLLYELRPSKSYAKAHYANVRLERHDLDDATCTCGTIPIPWVENTYGASPSDVEVFSDPTSGLYVVKSSLSTRGITSDSSILSTFRMTRQPTRHLQTARVFTMRHISSGVVLLALVALGIAFLRSRLAMSYALRIHTWTEARLAPEGMILDEAGATLGMLDQSSGQRFIRPGVVLVAPEAVSKAGVYRDMPIVPARSIAVNTHTFWRAGTMLRLRDARVLAIVSALCAALAFGARLIA